MFAWKRESEREQKIDRERERERERERGGCTKEFMARLSNSDPIRENVLKCKWCKITLRLALGK